MDRAPAISRLVAALAAVLVMGGAASHSDAGVAGTGPTAWVQSSFEDFGAGELVSVSLDSEGDVRLAPELAAWGDTGEAYVWSVDVHPDGTVYASAGTEGKVYRYVERSTEQVEPFFDADGTVHALAVGPDDHLYLAVSPGGEIFRVPLREGAERPSAAWADLESRYVWALVFGADGTLYAATGGEGKIYRVGADGTAAVLYDSDEEHVTSLAIDQGGNVLAGSADGGHLYRISPDGGVFVLFDAPMKQITGIVPAGNSVFFSALEQSPGGSGDDGESGGAAIAGSSGETPRGAVYHLREDGLVEQLWGSAELSPHALAPLGSGVVVGTGGKGRLLHVAPGPVTEILADADAGQVTTLRAQGSGLVVGTSNLGRIYRLGTERRSTGSLLSRIRDTETTSQWGRVRWRGATPEGTSIRLYVRSGNTAEPDETWSAWSGPYDDPRGSRIDSPEARFVQWKAELVSEDAARSPVLQWVELVYVQRNLRPEIEDFTLHPAGVIYRQNSSFEDSLPIGRLPSPVRQALDEQRGRDAATAASSTSFLGQAYYLQGSQTFSWEAADPNGDQMTYSLWYRGESETAWKPVATRLTETTYLWDTTTVPDGLYRARLLASDAPSNPEGQDLEGSRRSEPFVVDNTAPRIDNVAATRDGGTVRVAGMAADDISLIRSMEYAVDGGEWNAVLPADGIPDATVEEIDFVIDGMEPGEHTIVVRVTDNTLNSGTARLVVTIQ